MVKYIELPTAGKILKEEFLEPLGLTQKFLSEQINVPDGRISEIINGKRIITADTDLRLTKYFGLSEGYFLRIQANLDLRRTKRAINKDIAKIIPFKAITKDMKSQKFHKKVRKPSNEYIPKFAITESMLKTYDKLTKNNEKDLNKKQA